MRLFWERKESGYWGNDRLFSMEGVGRTGGGQVPGGQAITQARLSRAALAGPLPTGAPRHLRALVSTPWDLGGSAASCRAPRCATCMRRLDLSPKVAASLPPPPLYPISLADAPFDRARQRCSVFLPGGTECGNSFKKSYRVSGHEPPSAHQARGWGRRSSDALPQSPRPCPSKGGWPEGTQRTSKKQELGSKPGRTEKPQHSAMCLFSMDFYTFPNR